MDPAGKAALPRPGLHVSGTRINSGYNTGFTITSQGRTKLRVFRDAIEWKSTQPSPALTQKPGMLVDGDKRTNKFGQKLREVVF